MTRYDTLLMKMYNQAMFRTSPAAAKLLVQATGGLKDVREEWKRQKTQADQDAIDQVIREADEWLADLKKQKQN